MNKVNHFSTFKRIFMDSEDFNKIKNIVLETIKENGLHLKHVAHKFGNDPEIVLEAVKKYGLTLKYASENLQNDYDIVLEAVKQNEIALQYASKNLQNNPELLSLINPCLYQIDTYLNKVNQYSR